MSLIDRVTPFKKSKEIPYEDIFLGLRDQPEFPYELALESLENLENSAQTEHELMEYFLEDIIFSSLYATFYEQILMTIRDNPQFTKGLIDEFATDQESREHIIAVQTEAHAQFVKNNGICPGCAFCENHGDVAELITYWNKKDYNFFAGFYVGMQTIQNAMEQLLYDFLPNRPELASLLSEENILKYRKKIIDYTDKTFF